MNRKLGAEIVGWYGAAVILLAYALVSFRIIPAGGYIYQTLNLIGAIGIVIVSLVKKAQQPAILNMVWAIIALMAIMGLVMH